MIGAKQQNVWTISEENNS